MDFSKIKEITIPEGSVKELSINGQVVWKKKPAGFTITLSGSNSFITKLTKEVDGVREDISWSNDTTILMPAGSKLTVYGEAGAYRKGNFANAYIYFKGQQVKHAEENYYTGIANTSYTFTVDADYTITSRYVVHNSSNHSGWAYINLTA